MLGWFQKLEAKGLTLCPGYQSATCQPDIQAEELGQDRELINFSWPTVRSMCWIQGGMLSRRGQLYKE